MSRLVALLGLSMSFGCVVEPTVLCGEGTHQEGDQCVPDEICVHDTGETGMTTVNRASEPSTSADVSKR